MSFIRNLWGWLSGRDQQDFANAMHELREEVDEKDWSDTESSGSLSRYPTLYHFILFRVRLLDPTRR